MKQRLVLLALAAGCMIFALIGAVIFLGQDRRAPEITVKDEEISYTEGESYDVLLEGVTAKDNRDGDLTDEVFVDKILQTGEDTAVVYYGVMDKNHNVGTGRRTIEYHPSTDGNANDADETETDETTDSQEEGQAAAADTQSEQQEDEELQPDGVRPALALTASETTIPAGTAFDPMSVVKDAVDDVDTRDSLYQRISANGTYDTNVPGTYTIQYFVTDSSGNTSDPQNFTLIVQ